MQADQPSVEYVVTVNALGESPTEAIDEHLVVSPLPEPEPLSASEVRVAVRSAAVGWVDLIMMSGQYQHMAKPPYVPGLEYAGEVVAIGDDVTQHRVGDRVISDGLKTGPRSRGAYQRYGGFTSLTVAPEDGLVALPDRLTFDQGCQLLSSYETAYHCLVVRGQLGAGETVLICGASGSTGLAAVHLAKLLGAKVIATGRSEKKLAVVAEQGADHVVQTKRNDAGRFSFRDRVKELTEGRGVDVVYDAVGGDLSNESMRCLRFGGRFLIVGWASTPFVADGQGRRGSPRANQLPTNYMMMKGLDVLGCPAAISAHHRPELRAPRRKAVLDWAKAGEIAPLVGATFPLKEVRTALRTKWDSSCVGAVVLNP